MQPSILDLANSSSAEKKNKLADHVSELLADRRPDADTEESSLLNNILSGVYDSLEVTTRQGISQRLAQTGSLSPALAQTLASDHISIAAPVLEHSEALSSEDIADIAKTKSQDHLLALAKRPYLDETASKELIKHGHTRVRHAVATNLGADLSQEDFENLMVLLPQQMGNKVRHLRKSNKELIEDLFENGDKMPKGLPLEKRDSKIDLKAWFVGIRRGRTTVNKAICQMAREQNLYDAARLLSFLTGLRNKYMLDLMIRYDATGIASACRAVGLVANDYQAVCRARCHHLKFPESTGNKWLTNYHMLSETDARGLIGMMKLKLQMEDPGTQDSSAA